VDSGCDRGAAAGATGADNAVCGKAGTTGSGAVSGIGLVNLVLALRDVHARLTGGSWGGPDAG